MIGFSVLCKPLGCPQVFSISASWRQVAFDVVLSTPPRCSPAAVGGGLSMQRVLSFPLILGGGKHWGVDQQSTVLFVIW